MGGKRARVQRPCAARKRVAVAARRPNKSRARPPPRSGKYAKRQGYTKRTLQYDAPYGTVTNRTGRPLRHNLRNAWKVLDAGMEKTKLYWTAYKAAFASSFGQNDLRVQQNILGAALRAPINIFDVTCCPNKNAAGAVVEPPAKFFLTFTNETSSATAFWTQDSGVQPTWKLMNAPGIEGDAGAVYPRGRAMLDWVSVRLMLYAPQLLPGKYRIDLVQFTDERLQPTLPTGDGTEVALRNNQFACAFWQYFTKQLVVSPIALMNNNMSKYVKYLKTVEVDIVPKQTDDQSATNTRDVKIFHRFNKVVDYAWDQNNRSDMVDTGDDRPQLDLGDDSQRLHPKERVYLVIRAFGNVSPAFSTQVHGSYDAALQTCFTNLA